MAHSGENNNITYLFHQHPATTVCPTTMLRAVVANILCKEANWDDSSLQHFIEQLFFVLKHKLTRSTDAVVQSVEHIPPEEANAYQPSPRLLPADGTKPWHIDVVFEANGSRENHVIYVYQLAKPNTFRVELVYTSPLTRQRVTNLDVLVTF